MITCIPSYSCFGISHEILLQNLYFSCPGPWLPLSEVPPSCTLPTHITNTNTHTISLHHTHHTHYITIKCIHISYAHIHTHPYHHQIYTHPISPLTHTHTHITNTYTHTTSPHIVLPSCICHQPIPQPPHSTSLLLSHINAQRGKKSILCVRLILVNPAPKASKAGDLPNLSE